VVGNLILVLLEIYCSLQQCKNFANPPTIDKVIAIAMVAHFLTHGVLWPNGRPSVQLPSSWLITLPKINKYLNDFWYVKFGDNFTARAMLALQALY